MARRRGTARLSGLSNAGGVPDVCSSEAGALLNHTPYFIATNIATNINRVASIADEHGRV